MLCMYPFCEHKNECVKSPHSTERQLWPTTILWLEHWDRRRQV